MSTDLPLGRCPVCAYGVGAPFFDGGEQPLATLGWPRNAEEAQGMTRLPLAFLQCPACTHVWNSRFAYEAVPYQNNPNRMFNAGGNWKGHLAETRDLVVERLPANPIVIDIGCGEGHFLRGVAQACGAKGRFLGFDPNASPETGVNLDFQARLFEPLSDMPAFAPDAVVIRHVLEHLTEPAAFLDEMAWGASYLGKTAWLFAETPCIDRVFETGRLADFFFEHVSHFTTRSFAALMARAGEVVTLAHGYDGEVVYALVKLGVPAELHERARASRAFAARAEVSREAIRAELAALAASGAKVAIWGGTGKAAAFMHQFGADAVRFPLVVDSDPDKAGQFVPGPGQEIRFRDVLKGMVLDVVIIPTQWRAKDIVAEMGREGITAARVLIEHDGRLVDFGAGEHPYPL